MSSHRKLLAAVSLLLVGLAALALACFATAVDLRGHGSVAAAPGDGFLKPNPQNLTVIEGHRVAIPVALTTCADSLNQQCHLGAFDLTMNFNPTIFGVLLEGRTATGATSNTITVATARREPSDAMNATPNSSATALAAA